jgi:UDP-N-acetyl-D-mannosaminuronic acid dehydrogenase
MTKKICVLGLGYIGLPTSALLAGKGYRIHGVDVMTEVVSTINSGAVHIVEPDLEIFVKAAVDSGRLKAALEPEEADVFIIAVPTPFKDDHVPNIDYVLQATVSIAPFIRKGNIVILESTSPVGTTEQVASTLQKEGVDLSEIYIAHCPERVLPGHIMRELVENDRIVGGINAASTAVAAEFYRSFVKGEVLETDAKTAEMVKLTENSFRDVNIAFANELSMLCERFGIDVQTLISLANRHPRVNILKPGCGVGGHCIAVDPWFIVSAADGQARLIETARRVNDSKAEWVLSQVEKAAAAFTARHGRKPVLACMGLAFKPDIDDLRESPALHIAGELQKRLTNVLMVEPNLKIHQKFTLHNYQDAVNKADIIVLLVAHKEFKSLNTGKAVVMDFCGVCVDNKRV